MEREQINQNKVSKGSGKVKYKRKKRECWNSCQFFFFTQQKINSTISIGDIQVDNLQYDSGQYDFAVIATTRDVRLDPEVWPPIMNMFNERNAFAMKLDSARFVLKICNDEWSVGTLRYNGKLLRIRSHKRSHKLQASVAPSNFFF